MLAVLPAIAALRRRQQYVQVESILHEAANGPSGMSLNDHNILSYLSLLQHKIDSIITNYVGVNNIISIIDLEQELVHILNIFCSATVTLGAHGLKSQASDTPQRATIEGQIVGKIKHSALPTITHYNTL